MAPGAAHPALPGSGVMCSGQSIQQCRETEGDRMPADQAFVIVGAGLSDASPRSSDPDIYDVAGDIDRAALPPR